MSRGCPFQREASGDQLSSADPQRFGGRARAGLGPTEQSSFIRRDLLSRRVLEGRRAAPGAGSGTSGNRTAVLALCKTLLGSRRPRVGFSDSMGLRKCFSPSKAGVGESLTRPPHEAGEAETAAGKVCVTHRWRAGSLCRGFGVIFMFLLWLEEWISSPLRAQKRLPSEPASGVREGGCPHWRG